MQKEIEMRLNKLFKEYEIKLAKCKTEQRQILVDFAREYQEVWK